MKSNYHTVRQAIEHRGMDRSGAKLGGAKPRTWAFNDKRDRIDTGRAQVSHPQGEVLNEYAMPIGYDKRKAFILARSYAPMKRERR